MIKKDKQDLIIKIWDNYINQNKTVLNTKGNVINDIDIKRIKAIDSIKILISNFQNNEINVYEFKTALDSYNKRNNLWGFTATKGQMFFNHLTRTNESNIKEFTELLKAVISEPVDLNDAGLKIEILENFSQNIFSNATDKRKAPNPGSTGYFLSYFWQIHNFESWPILYTSLTNSLKELDIWVDLNTQKEGYKEFYKLNEEIKIVIESHAGFKISNWDAEHAFWNYSGNPHSINRKEKKEAVIETRVNENIITSIVNSNFQISDYLIPKISKLVEVGNQNEKSASSKGSEFEKIVAEAFKLLGFEVQVLGQGSGRNPDAIIKYREDHTAFIVDAKAYNDGYVMGRDDRAMKEYIATYCPQLRREGFTKIGFIIVSNSFKTDLKEFRNEITWMTDIKRFILLTSEALLYYIAYKTKDDRITLQTIIESLISFENVISFQDVIEEFDDI